MHGVSPPVVGTRIARLVKSLDLQSIDHRFKPHRRGGGFFSDMGL